MLLLPKNGGKLEEIKNIAATSPVNLDKQVKYGLGVFRFG